MEEPIMTKYIRKRKKMKKEWYVQSENLGLCMPVVMPLYDALVLALSIFFIANQKCIK
jgi:hypothetical protein